MNFIRLFENEDGGNKHTPVVVVAKNYTAGSHSFGSEPDTPASDPSSGATYEEEVSEQRGVLAEGYQRGSSSGAEICLAASIQSKAEGQGENPMKVAITIFVLALVGLFLWMYIPFMFLWSAGQGTALEP